MLPLLAIAVQALGQHLCWGSGPISLTEVPQAELAREVYQAWQRCLSASAAAGRPPPLARQHQVLAAFGAAAWRPLLLRLVYAGGSIPTGLASLPLVAGRLLHLELSAPALQHLEGIAAACPQLRCLSLRGCCQLGDASLAGLAGCTSLRALDLGGLAVLTDAAVFHIAKLPQLAALNLSGTGVGDATLQLLIYGHKVRGWQAAAGAARLPPEAAAWPPLPLEHLQLAGTRAGAEGAAELAHLPQLRFLDMRRTGIARAALALLERRFALQFVQGAVLSSSNSVAAAVLNQETVLCRCGCGSSTGPSAASATAAQLEAWEARGVQQLLHYDPASGLASVLESEHQPLAWRRGAWAPSPLGAPPERPQAGVPGGRRIGYRQPRPAGVDSRR